MRKLNWVPAGNQISVGELPINSGMFYFVKGQSAGNGEASAVELTLPVSSRAENPIVDLGYWPSYSGITPQQRRTYLEWLAAGRSDSDPAQRSLGYVFLFFYGLERRILVEKDNDPAILAELVRLLSLYGPANKSRSLRSYFLQLCHYGGWRQGVAEYRALWPQFIELDGERPNEDGLRFVLANLHQNGETLDWIMAYRLALSMEECKRSTVVTRAREQFWELFQQRYREAYPEGMVLLASKQHSVERYAPASASLPYYGSNSDQLCTRIPNVLGMRKQFTKLPGIWNSCVEDLSGFSRTLNSGKQGLGAEIKVWQALPDDLRASYAHPLQQSFQELMGSAVTEGSHTFVPVSTLATMMGIPQKARLTPGQSREMAEAIGHLGYLLAPDTRLTGLPLQWDQEVALSPVAPLVDAHMAGLVRLLYLSMAVAAADDFIEDAEVEQFNSLVSPDVSNENAWAVLRATEQLLRRDVNVAVRAIPQICRQIPVPSREAVLRTMIHIAAADGEVGLDESKLLRKMARALELAETLPDQIVQDRAEFSEIRVEIAGAQKSSGERIPPKPVAGPSVPAFQLDVERLRVLTQETHEVINLLSQVMTEEEPAPPQIAEVEVMPVENPTSAMPEWAAALEGRYHAAFLEIIRYDTMPGTAFDALAQRNHLLPADLLDSVNAWSDETLGDFLLEREDDVQVFRDLLPDRTTLSNAA